MSKGMIGLIPLADVLAAVNDFYAKAAGEDGAMWLSAFLQFLQKKNFWPAFPVWRRIVIGAHESAVGYEAAIEAKGNRLTDWARQILTKTPVASSREELELVLVTGAQLGFDKAATRAQIYERAAAFGLVPCPAEVGLALREQYQEQPLGEWILVAMEPIEVSDRYPVVFGVERDDGGRWLNASSGNAVNEWDPGNRWVFLRRKP